MAGSQRLEKWFKRCEMDQSGRVFSVLRISCGREPRDSESTIALPPSRVASPFASNQPQAPENHTNFYRFLMMT
ncbi:hypothetical protein EVAR_101547_1, partial [Eumeta japonica]